MAYSGLIHFIKALDEANELLRIKTFTDPVLEITEITDRVSKAGGKALLFENTGTHFPLLINAYGSAERMSIVFGRKNTEEAVNEIISLFSLFSNASGTWLKKLSSLPALIKVAGYLPVKTKRKGICQQIIIKDPDLSILPVLKCWPHDGGRFITLPMVHTVHPLSGDTNVGMYRMQIIDRNTTAMHWQRHKTGANHCEAWRKTGSKMPVSVALGGDPVYAYSATAPMPENMNEYILAGFLRKKKVKMVKCITNDNYVPDDADIVIEGYVDPNEEMIVEGPFGDHTGFYSLPGLYPRFHVTCITHAAKACYPATIVGIPPMEDAWLTTATEKIFLAPLKLVIQPEIEDLHMPDAGVAHNLAIVKINKSYPGQGKKVINSLFGAGQMMFTKYLIVVSGDIDIRNYKSLFTHVSKNVDVRSDLIFTTGPLDVLDHSSDSFSVGGKMGIDGTEKMKEETGSYGDFNKNKGHSDKAGPEEFPGENEGKTKINIFPELNMMVLGLNTRSDKELVERTKVFLRNKKDQTSFRFIAVVDHTIDITDIFMVSWQLLSNADPLRDILIIHDNTVFIDGSLKVFTNRGFPREWPNIVCSSEETINAVDEKWKSLGVGPFIPSPSLTCSALYLQGDGKVIVT